MRRWFKYSLRAAIGGMALCGAALWFLLAGSRAQLSGRVIVPDLSADVAIDRDDRGIPTIKGRMRADVATGLGFVHAQDRFFQMDLLRRRAAGELAELLGQPAVAADKKSRRHEFRQRAQRSLARLTPSERTLLDAYVKGVNAGLVGLVTWPFEYYLLRAAPQRWKPEDTLLVAYALYMELQDDDGWYDAARSQLAQQFSGDVYDFFVHNGSAWDAALDDSRLPMRQVPDAAQFAAPRVPRVDARADAYEPKLNAGSSAWVATDGDAAILSNDLHLRLRVPNTWYRSAWAYQTGDEETSVCGVTLPGLPIMVIGSNRHIAWGLANCEIDTTDLVVVESVPEEPDQYRTPAGIKRLDRHTESISVRSGPPVTVEIARTIWGPVVGRNDSDKPLALAWAAHDERAINLRLADLETAKDVDAALAVKNAVQCPAMNLVLADRSGRIAWSLIGVLPHRSGYNGEIPVSFASGGRSLEFITAAAFPSLVDPKERRLWAANNRFLGDAQAMALGCNGMAEGARAKQIKDHLERVERLDASAMLAVQLDDHAVFLERWRELLGQVIASREPTGDALERELAASLDDWDGRATKESVAYRLVRDFKSAVTQRVFKRVLQACYRAMPDFSYSCFMFEEPIWMLVQAKPAHLVDPASGSWDAELAKSFDDVVAGYRRRYGSSPQAEQLRWGERNTLAIHHPLAANLGWFARFLNMPADSVGGDRDMPSVASPNFGASLRMIVTPGAEAAGRFAMPCGQSSHPLSDFYRKGHDEWVRGEAGPLLPGTARHHLTLQSAKR